MPAADSLAVPPAAPHAHVRMQASRMRPRGGRLRPSRGACLASMCRVSTLAFGLGGRRWAAVLADTGVAGGSQCRQVDVVARRLCQITMQMAPLTSSWMVLTQQKAWPAVLTGLQERLATGRTRCESCSSTV